MAPRRIMRLTSSARAAVAVVGRMSPSSAGTALLVNTIEVQRRTSVLADLDGLWACLLAHEDSRGARDGSAPALLLTVKQAEQAPGLIETGRQTGPDWVSGRPVWK